MSDNSKHDHHDHTCSTQCSTSILYQTLEELDFERGIWYAAQYGDIDKVNKLLLQGTSADFKDAAGYTALHYASRSGHLNICKLLLQNGADINAVTKAGHATALHRACSAGKIHIAKYLLQSRANVELKDIDGKTALHRAAENQHKKICQFLIEVCPKILNEIDNKGNTATHYLK